MKEPTHTPKPWHKGHGSFIIATHPVGGLIGSDDVEYYGGHLVCESVAPQNMDLISAAPEMLEALVILLNDAEHMAENGDMSPERESFAIARAAIAKAKPQHIEPCKSNSPTVTPR